MKILKTVLILIVLFGLPAGSWYFLKYGFNWRKNKIEVLQSKGHFLNDIPWTEDEKNRLYSAMFFKTNIVQLEGSIESEEQQIIDQFMKAPTFRYISLLDSSDSIPTVSTKDVKRYVQVDGFKESGHEFASAKYMIVDTAFNIRQVYMSKDVEALSALVEDFSLVLPRQKEKDISIKSKSN